VELDDADKSAPWQPNPQRELPAPRGQFSRKDWRDVLAQSLEDKSAELRSGYRTASGHGVFNREGSWQLGGARERTPTRPRVCWRTHGRTPGTCALVLSGPGPRSSAHTRTTATTSEPVVRERVSASSQTSHYSMGGVALRKVPFPLLDFAVGQFRVRCREHAGHRVPVLVAVLAMAYQGLTTIPMPECRNRGPPRPNPGCSSSPRGRYPSSSFPLTASA
jgi:hypothetical protein